MSTAVESANGYSRAETQRPDPRAQAEAEAIRAKAAAEAEAVKIKAAEEAEKQRIANERARLKLEKDQADHDTYLARKRQQKEEADRAAAAARKQAEEAQLAEAEQAKDVELTARRWRRYAIGFYTVCAVVALPVQVAAFWDPSAWWLVIAPFMLEGGAAVVLKGAAAAVAAGRPHWHYRLIAWVLAFIAAGVNLWHGMNAFDPATAVGTAFASVAGPGVWDLHEHGRIRARDGKPSRRQRRAAAKAERRAAAEKKAREAKAEAEKKAREKDEEVAAQRLAEEREKYFPKVWEHAVKLAAALGHTSVTDAVWKRAYKDIEGTEPHESVDIIRTRNAAERRAAAARSGGGSKVNSSQRTSQVPPSREGRTYKPPTRRGIRRPGDTPKYVNAARKQAALAAKNAASDSR